MVSWCDRCATATNRQSTSSRWLIRLASAPGRNVVSVPADTRTCSATWARLDRGWLVTAAVVAPAARARRNGSVTSGVSPEWDTATPDVARTQQGRVGEPSMCVGARVGPPTDPVQLLGQVLGDQTGGAHPVDHDPVGVDDRGGELLEHRRIDLGGGVEDGPHLRLRELGHHVGHGIAHRDVPGHGAVGRPPPDLPRQPQPEVGVAGEAQAPRRTHHGGLADLRQLRHVGDAEPRDEPGIVEQRLGDSGRRG